MIRKIIFIALIFSSFLITAVCQAAEEPATPTPKAVFPEKHFEFPSVLEGTEVRHDFVVQNSGSETLKILGVKTG
jgi:hypothetical protein